MRYGVVALWQLTGMACTLGVGALLVFSTNMIAGQGATTSLRLLPHDLLWLFSGVILITPLSLVVLWAWVRACGRFPALEGSPQRAIMNLVVVAMILAMLAGAISSWEASIATFLDETFSVARAVIGWATVGVVLPRVLVPVLRPGRITQPRDVVKRA